MSDIITVRDGDIIAAEINTIKEDTRRIMIANAIRIGGKLVEAKAMVPFGEWGKWLEEKVDYSQSTANNLMKLYQEYGSNQESLFDNWTKSEAFANLSYSQHMALLALPFSDRAEFAEKNDVEHMSTRELDKAVREELEKTKAALAESEQLREEACADMEEFRKKTKKEQETLQEAVHQATYRAQEAEAEIAGHAKTADAALRDKQRAENSEKTALGLVKKLETELLTAQTAEKTAREELKKVLENPTVPEDVMAKLRKEAETEAARVAADKAQKGMEKVQKELEAAKQEAEVAARARAEAEERAAQLQKQAKMSDPDIIAYQTLAEQLMQSYNVLNGYRLKVAANSLDAGERLKKFQTAMVSQWLTALQEV